LIGHSSSVYHAAQVGPLVWTGSWDKSICAWNPQAHEFVRKIETSHTDAISLILPLWVPSRNAWDVATASWDRSIHVWHVPASYADSSSPPGSVENAFVDNNAEGQQANFQTGSSNTTEAKRPPPQRAFSYTNVNQSPNPGQLPITSPRGRGGKKGGPGASRPKNFMVNPQQTVTQTNGPTSPPPAPPKKRIPPQSISTDDLYSTSNTLANGPVPSEALLNPPPTNIPAPLVNIPAPLVNIPAPSTIVPPIPQPLPPINSTAVPKVPNSSLELPKSIDDCITRTQELSIELKNIEVEQIKIATEIDLHENLMVSTLTSRDIKEESEAWTQMKTRLYELLRKETEMDSKRSKKASQILEVSQLRRMHFIKNIVRCKGSE